MYRYDRDDRDAEDLFVAQAQVSGYASSPELAAALGRGARTIRRMRQRFEAEGATGVLRNKTGPKTGYAA